MIISTLMQAIWKPIKEEFTRYYKEAYSMDLTELYHLLSQAKMTSYRYPKAGMNLLSTCGCDHFLKNGTMAGCSMCNYHCNNIRGTAYLKALRDKDVMLYARVVRDSFVKVRGVLDQQTGEETITGFNLFSDMEFPEQVLEYLFHTKPIYTVRPFIVSVEARADSITEKKLKRLIDLIGKGRLVIEIGVEVSREWIRNHWLNKNIRDNQILKTIQLCHQYHVKLKADVIFGLPGFTEQNSIGCFVDTIGWLHDVGCDYIAVMPLNRKEFTLQGCIYDKLRDHPRLTACGIAQAEHTGLPWIFSFIEALAMCFERFQGIEKKIGIGQYNLTQNSVQNTLFYNESSLCGCVEETRCAIENYNQRKDGSFILDLHQRRHQDPCYPSYQRLLQKQEKITNVLENCRIIGDELLKELNLNDPVLLHEWSQEIMEAEKGL